MSEIAQVDQTDLSENSKQAAFIALDPEVVGLSLRPLSAGTLIILKLTGNTLLDGSDKDIEFNVAAFLYVHSADPKEVRKASTNPEVFKERVIEFAENLTVPDFIQAANSVRDIIESAVVGQDYEVDQSGEQPSPNS